MVQPNQTNRVKNDIARMVANAVKDTTRQASRTLLETAELYARYGKNRKGLAKVNQALADGMMRSVRQRYADTVIQDKKVPSYRQGRGRFSGELWKALNSPSMAYGDGKSVGFIDDELLRNRAKHWYRLNFGALPRGSDAPPPARVTWGNRVLSQLTLPNTGPSEAFRLPEAPAYQGYFIAPTTRNAFGQFQKGSGVIGARPGQFYIREHGQKLPRGKYIRERRPTKGIQGRRFMDAGLSFFALNFQDQYETWLSGLGSDAARKNRTRRFRNLGI